MKKLGLIFMLGCIAFFGSCSDDDKDEPKPEAKDYAKEIQGKYVGIVDEAGNGGLQVILAGDTVKSDDAIYITRTDVNKVKLELKDFKYTDQLLIGDITLENLDVEGNDKEVSITSKEPIKQIVLGNVEAFITIESAKVTGKKVEIKLTIDVKGVGNVGVRFDGELSDKSGEAKLLEVSTEDDLILETTFNKEEKLITFLVATNTGLEYLEEVELSLKTSDKATAPAEIDLTAGEAILKVTAEDGVTSNEYKVIILHKDFTLVHNMEEWIPDYEGADYSSPIGGWNSSNTGVSLLKMMKYADRYNVTQDKGEKSSVAKLETLDTKGKNLVFQRIPKVTAGSLFTGYFETDMENTLNSTKFGVAFSKKPLKLKGSYKYTAGPLFLRSTAAKANEFKEEPNTKDKGSINAILYDVTEDKSYITGFNTYKDTRIVAAVTLIVEDQATYTSFEKDFEFVKGKTYDSTKKYRIAIITSSSKDGDTFSGAPGSTLWIDNIEIVAE